MYGFLCQELLWCFTNNEEMYVENIKLLFFHSILTLKLSVTRTKRKKIKSEPLDENQCLFQFHEIFYPFCKFLYCQWCHTISLLLQHDIIPEIKCKGLSKLRVLLVLREKSAA